ncbi:MAG: mechanosensitive ion channel [Deltaproteobacteria bacterium]|nr:mechanosensitive ion channel [Deltaproteobacteria bacterium]MBW2521361.1 mechanosensitive ion channel [Deltaproteobacteria bacterium]
MEIEQFFRKLGEISSKPLFALSGTQVTLLSVCIFFLVIFFAVVLSFVLQRALKRTLSSRFKKREGTLAAILRLIHYTVVIIGFGIGLQTVGINISALFAAGAVFAIAIGFAMQNIVQNFVSGIILLVERTIKPGDILEVEGTVVKVVDMGIRTTLVRTWRDEELIMPNSIFSQSTVKNFTMRDNQFRLGITVGVAYESDMKKVVEVLEKTARDMPWRQPEPEPRVLLQDFGDSAVIFGVYLNVDDPWKQRVYMSDLRKAVWFALLENNITIAFNQIDIHFDPPVTEAFTGLTKIK